MNEIKIITRKQYGLEDFELETEKDLYIYSTGHFVFNPFVKTWIPWEKIERIILPPEDDFRFATSFENSTPCKVNLKEGGIIQTSPPCLREFKAIFLVLSDAKGVIKIPYSNIDYIQET